MRRKRPGIGDVIEIPTKKGLAYAQYSHFDSLYGYLIRVLPGFYPKRPSDLTALVNQSAQFVTFYILAAAYAQGLVNVVGNAAVPEEAKVFPRLRIRHGRNRTGEHFAWWVWDGDQKRLVDNELSPEDRQLSIAEVMTDVALVQSLESGWSPEKDV